MGESRSQRDAVQRGLREALLGVRAERAVVLCIGNPARADDGYGPAVAEALEGRLAAPVFDGGMVPENDLPRIAELQPDVVIFVDAVHFGGEPGELRLLRTDELRSGAISTHSGSLSVLEEFLGHACGCEVLVLAAQPKRTILGEEPSEEMKGAVQRSAALLRNLLAEPKGPA